MEEDRGTERCPIDLTDDASPPKKIRKLRRSESAQSLHSRISFVEKLSNLNEKELSVEPKPSSAEQVVNISNRCQSLENRISVLEKFLVGVRQLFLPNTISDPTSDVSQDQTCTTREINDVQSKSVVSSVLLTSDAAVETEAEEGHAVLNNETAASGEASDSASVRSDETIIISKDVVNTSEETIIYGNSPGSSPDKGDCEGLNDILPADDSRGSCNIRLREGEDSNCLVNNAKDEIDIKPFSLPPVISVKRELNLMRDDQGRVLIFLYCAAKRMSNTSSIVAVSGMYLHDQLHNEYVFTSQRSMKDVKVEAEIRAAYFGVETVKDLFSESLGDVCVMVISNCSQLVQSMKARKSYPSIHTCSCKFRNCEHSDLRWASQETLAKSQGDILPDLVLSMMPMLVHWCKVENISQEEKNVLDQYRDVVETVLSEAIRQNRNNK